MFWAERVSKDHDLELKLSEKSAINLHLSSLVLMGSENATLFVECEGEKHPVAHLSQKNSTVLVDLCFDLEQQEPVFSLDGPGEVTLLGYFDPEDLEESLKESEESEEDESDLEEELRKGMLVGQKIEKDEEESDEDEDSEDDIEENSDEEESNEEIPMKKQQTGIKSQKNPLKEKERFGKKEPEVKKLKKAKESDEDNLELEEFDSEGNGDDGDLEESEEEEDTGKTKGKPFQKKWDRSAEKKGFGNKGRFRGDFRGEKRGGFHQRGDKNSFHRGGGRGGFHRGGERGFNKGFNKSGDREEFRGKGGFHGNKGGDRGRFRGKGGFKR